HLAEHLRVARTDRRERAAAEPDIEPLRRRIVPHVVRIAAELDPTAWLKMVVEQLKTLALSVRDCDQLRVGRYGDALRLSKARNALDVRAALQAQHFYGVVAERRDEQALPRGIEREMIDPAFDARQRDRANRHQRFLRGQQRHPRTEHDTRQDNARHDSLWPT